MDLYEDLPDPAGLGLAAATRLRQRILTRTRPAILRRLTALGALAAPELAAQIERAELELRVAALDAHDWALDARITAAALPTLAHLMPALLDELAVTGDRCATARAPLFYSPEAKFNVHGPIMLLHAAALAERLLRDGEALACLELASFTRMVVSQLRLTVYDPAAAPRPSDARAASLTGGFRLSSGRRLAFWGVQDHAHPVARRAWINRLALALAPRDRAPERDGKLYRVHTPGAVAPDLWPAQGLSVPAQLMTAIDTLVMLMLTEPLHPAGTRLLLSIRDLPLGPDMLRELVVGTTLGFTPHRDRARRMGAMTMMPTDIAFARRPDAATRIMTGETAEPYYRLPVG